MVIVNKMAACIVEVMKSPKASGAGLTSVPSRKHAHANTQTATRHSTLAPLRVCVSWTNYGLMDYHDIIYTTNRHPSV